MDYPELLPPDDVNAEAAALNHIAISLMRLADRHGTDKKNYPASVLPKTTPEPPQVRRGTTFQTPMPVAVAPTDDAEAAIRRQTPIPGAHL